MRPVLRVLPVLLVALLVACPPPASIQTPEGRTAYAAGQVLQRVEELEQAAIAANATIDPKTGAPGLAKSTTRQVVTFCVGAARTLKTTPAGWRATVWTGFSQLQGSLTAEEAHQLAPYLAPLGAILAELANGGVP